MLFLAKDWDLADKNNFQITKQKKVQNKQENRNAVKFLKNYVQIHISTQKKLVQRNNESIYFKCHWKISIQICKLFNKNELVNNLDMSHNRLFCTSNCHFWSSLRVCLLFWALGLIRERFATNSVFHFLQCWLQVYYIPDLRLVRSLYNWKRTSLALRPLCN